METGTTSTQDVRAPEPLPLGVWLSAPVAAALLVFSIIIPGFFIGAVLVAAITGIIIAYLRRAYAVRDDNTGH